MCDENGDGYIVCFSGMIIAVILISMIKMVAVNLTMVVKGWCLIGKGQAVRCEESSLKIFVTNNLIVLTFIF